MIAVTGLELGFLVDLLIKTIYWQGLERPSDFSHEMKLPAGLMIKLIETALSMKLMETLGQLGASMTAEMRYALTGSRPERYFRNDAPPVLLPGNGRRNRSFEPRRPQARPSRQPDHFASR